VGNLAVVQVEIVRGLVICFENGKIFRVEMVVSLVAGVNSEKKREIGVVPWRSPKSGHL
jgi:hypothetical protein